MALVSLTAAISAVPESTTPGTVLAAEYSLSRPPLHKEKKAAVFTIFKEKGSPDPEWTMEEPLADGVAKEEWIDYFLFVDDANQPKLKNGSTWQVVNLKKFGREDVFRDCLHLKRPEGMPGLPISGHARAADACFARAPKIRPDVFLPAGYSHSIYIDPNIKLRRSPGVVIDILDKERADFATFSYPRQIRDEAERAISYLHGVCGLNRTEVDRMRSAFDTLLEKYSTKGDSHWNRTMYSKVVVRHHGGPVNTFNQLWWKEFTSGAPRDQLPMRWCAREATRRTGIFKALDLGDPRAEEAPMWHLDDGLASHHLLDSRNTVRLFTNAGSETVIFEHERGLSERTGPKQKQCMVTDGKWPQGGGAIGGNFETEEWREAAKEFMRGGFNEELD